MAALLVAAIQTYTYYCLCCISKIAYEVCRNQHRQEIWTKPFKCWPWSVYTSPIRLIDSFMNDQNIVSKLSMIFFKYYDNIEQKIVNTFKILLQVIPKWQIAKLSLLLHFTFLIIYGINNLQWLCFSYGRWSMWDCGWMKGKCWHGETWWWDQKSQSRTFI